MGERGKRLTNRGLDVPLKLSVSSAEWEAIQVLTRREFRGSEYDWIRETLRPVLLPVMKELAAKTKRPDSTLGEVVKR